MPKRGAKAEQPSPLETLLEDVLRRLEASEAYNKEVEERLSVVEQALGMKKADPAHPVLGIVQSLFDRKIVSSQRQLSLLLGQGANYVNDKQGLIATTDLVKVRLHLLSIGGHDDLVERVTEVILSGAAPEQDVENLQVATRKRRIRAGRVGGRPRALDPLKVQLVKALMARGDLTMSEIAAKVGVNVSTIYRAVPGGRGTT